MVGAHDKPAADIVVDAELARALLTEQVPHMASFDLIEVAEGWDNVVFRLGDLYAVRLPRRRAAAVLVEHEQRWLPELAPTLPLPVPVPVHAGRPTSGYPWAWSVLPWLPGVAAVLEPPADLLDAANTLGAFVAALHRPAPPNAPANPVRGVPLADRDDALRGQITRLGAIVDGDDVLGRWEEALAVPPWSGEPRWLHGDLHPGNILVHEGQVSAVIDFGDITAGDPANDLALGWMLFPESPRRAFRDAADPDDATWQRARGWALALAVAFIANSSDDPHLHALGTRTLAAVMTD